MLYQSVSWTDRRLPPPSISLGMLAARVTLGASMLVSVLVGGTLLAQGRVVLFESGRLDGVQRSPGLIREVEVAAGGRVWTVQRAIEVPAHETNGAPVATADGARLVWLAREGTTTLLAQYEFATGRASLVDVGRFHTYARLVADPLRPRVFVLEPHRVVVIDATLQPRAIDFAGADEIVNAFVIGDRLIVQRRRVRSWPADDDLVLVDLRSGEIQSVLPLGFSTFLAVSADGQRVYRAYSDSLSFESRIDLLAFPSGQLLARKQGAGLGWVMQLDEARGILIYTSAVAGSYGLSALDMRTLDTVADLDPTALRERTNIAVTQTADRTAILVFSRVREVSYFDQCLTTSPRIDVFDGASLGLVNQIDLQGRCPRIVAIPSRP